MSLLSLLNGETKGIGIWIPSPTKLVFLCIGKRNGTSTPAHELASADPPSIDRSARRPARRPAHRLRCVGGVRWAAAAWATVIPFRFAFRNAAWATVILVIPFRAAWTSLSVSKFAKKECQPPLSCPQNTSQDRKENHWQSKSDESKPSTMADPSTPARPSDPRTFISPPTGDRTRARIGRRDVVSSDEREMRNLIKSIIDETWGTNGNETLGRTF